MSFIQANIKNPTRSLKEVPKGTSTVVVKGRLQVWSSGLAVEAAAGATVATMIGVANQDIAAAESLAIVPVIELFPNDVWIADSTNNSNVAHNGQEMVIGANGGIVNNTGTTDTAGVVQQVGVYGAAADKKILVRFLSLS
jgi:2-methylcitrate dehydratase PrpD